MLAVQLFRSHVKGMAICLYRQNCHRGTVFSATFKLRQGCWYMAASYTKPACFLKDSDNKFGTIENSLRRFLCSDVTATVKAKGRKLTVPKEETTEYMTSLGLDCDAILQDQPMVLLEDVSKVKNHVTFLQSLNLTDAEILDILQKTPELLKVDTSSIQEHIDYLQGMDLEGLLILNIFQRVPRFFATPLSRIQSNVEYIQSLDLTDKNMRILFKYAPSLFYRRKNGVRNAGERLRRILLEHNPHCNPATSLRYMLRTDPLLFMRSDGEIEHRVEHLISLGFSGVPLAKIIRFCPSVLRIGTEFITERLRLVEKLLSLTTEQSLDMVMRLPKILHASNQTIETKVDFLFKREFSAADIFQAPRVLNTSLQRLESRLDKLSELNYRPPSLSIMQRTDEWFTDFLEQLTHKQKVKADKLKCSSEE